MEKIANKKKHAFSIKVITAICGSFLCGVIFLKAPLWGTAVLISFVTALAGFEMTVASQLVSMTKETATATNVKIEDLFFPIFLWFKILFHIY